MATYHTEQSATVNLDTAGDVSADITLAQSDRTVQVIPNVTSWGEGPALVELRWASTNSSFVSFDPPVYLRSNEPSRVLDLARAMRLQLYTVTAGGSGADAPGQFYLTFGVEYRVNEAA